MSSLAKHRNLVLLAASVAALSGCGAEKIVSPGTGGNVSIVNNTPAPPPPPPPPVSTLVTPAAGCPTIDDPLGLKDLGTITGPTGTYRNCELPARITRSSRLTKIPGLLYSMGGRVDVGSDLGAARVAGEVSITLTIDPGVVVFGSSGVSWLAVNRGHKIAAVGNAASPIVFTSRDNVLGLATDDSQGQWGGVVLLGRAPITDCTVAPAAVPGSVNCERQTEGAVDPAYFGGATPADNSGTMKYVQIRYSGYVLSGNSELQALTPSGVGSGTVLQYIHSHNSSDDGLEAFGGTVDMKNLVVTGADDDTIDLDVGYRGLIQYVIGNTAAMLFRGAADASLVNGLVVSSMACLRLSGANILTTDAAIDKIGAPVFKSVAMQCNANAFVGSSGLTAQQVSDVFNVAGNNNSSVFTSTLTSTFVNGANETAVTATDPKTIATGFDTTTAVGAVKSATDTWYAGWTCNSVTANFGSSSKACTSLPTL